MTPPPDPFEQKLQSFRPRPPSPTLRRRIAGQLAAAPVRRWRAAATALVAACVALAVLLPRGRGPDTVVVIPPPPPAAGPPTVLAYHQALARSPEALDDLLDRQAVRAPQAGVPAQPVTAFAYHADLLTWRGNH
jgi:hypothetical protein